MYVVSHALEINLLQYLMSRSISGLFLGVSQKSGFYQKFSDSLFALNHLFKNSNSISVSLKSSRLQLININIVTPTSGTVLDFSLTGLIDILCKVEKVKVVKLFLLKLPDYESYI